VITFIANAKVNITVHNLLNVSYLDDGALNRHSVTHIMEKQKALPSNKANAVEKQVGASKEILEYATPAEDPATVSQKMKLLSRATSISTQVEKVRLSTLPVTKQPKQYVRFQVKCKSLFCVTHTSLKI